MQFFFTFTTSRPRLSNTMEKIFRCMRHVCLFSICMYVNTERCLLFGVFQRGSVHVDPTGGWCSVCTLQKKLKEDVDAVYWCGFSSRDTCTWAQLWNAFSKFRLVEIAGVWCHTVSHILILWITRMVRDSCARQLLNRCRQEEAVRSILTQMWENKLLSHNEWLTLWKLYCGEKIHE